MRHKEPSELAQFRELVSRWPPRCCHTCDNYSQTGECFVHKCPPPKDFANNYGSGCPQWTMEIPF
jgi:hypothetical protein